jgi:hypothetical protein
MLESGEETGIFLAQADTLRNSEKHRLPSAQIIYTVLLGIKPGTLRINLVLESPSFFLFFRLKFA